MDSNYGWQKQQANEKLQARQRDAQMHRLVKQQQKKGESSSVRSIVAFLLFLFLLVVGYFLPN